MLQLISVEEVGGIYETRYISSMYEKTIVNYIPTSSSSR